MSTTTDLNAILSQPGREGLGPLVDMLGFVPSDEPVPAEAWTGWGLGQAAEVTELAVVGRAGSLLALYMAVRPGTSPERLVRLVRRVRARNPARLFLFLLEDTDARRLTIGVFGLDGTFHHLNVERDRVRPSDREALSEMMPGTGEEGLELTVRHASALDRSRITRRFFRDFRSRRSAISAAWTGIPADAGEERARLALLLLSRLTFLYFLQRRGALAGDDAYIPHLWGAWCGRSVHDGEGPDQDGEEVREGQPASFYRSRLVPLFFGVLNRRPEDRVGEARDLGPLPYLNGGLFEPHVLERRHRELDLPDGEIRACLDDLFERYRFTTREAGEGAGHGVDPEVLGRVFEGLMAPEERSDTGSFYTPAEVVDRVVREAVTAYVTGPCSPAEARALVDGDASGIDQENRYRVRGALERIRVLDPACGSGAFLLGALQRLAAALGQVSGNPPGEIRRTLVARSLHGVDLLDDAALLCALRLWLALTVADDEIRPLPNLDRRIRQGDALIDPLDLESLELSDPDGPGWHPVRDPDVRGALRAIEPAARRYLESGPEDRDRLRAALERAESRLARRWVRGVRTAWDLRLRSIRARAADRDLFGDATDGARRAGTLLPRVEERVEELDVLDQALADRGALPFFSFGIHFADAADGFDMVLSNPPWVRSHRWPDRVRRLADRFEVCREPGSRRVARATGSHRTGSQVDLSLLFVERAIRLLAPGGILAVLLPAKALRAVYGGAARRMLLRELEPILIEDHALDQRSIFRADAFAAVLVGRKRGASAPQPRHGSRGPMDHRVHLVRRGVEPLDFKGDAGELPLFPDDPASPWLLAPPDAVAAFRAMQSAGPPLGEHPELRVRRGIMTGANDVLLFSAVEPKLAGLARVEAEGYRRARRQGRSRSTAGRYRGVVELDGLRPLVRGSDIDAFCYRTTSYTAWCHDGDGRPAPPPPRLARYLDRHRSRLEGRAGWRAGLPLGCVFRLGRDTLRPKVAWHDLSDTLRAVALPAAVRREGTDRELVPLNTVYFIPVADPGDAELLAGIFNAMPVRVFARTVAERAKDARFRFFAWTVSCLPLPERWKSAPSVETIRRISARSHAAGGITPEDQQSLDLAVFRLYGLSDEHRAALARFDAWLQGEAPAHQEEA